MSTMLIIPPPVMSAQGFHRLLPGVAPYPGSAIEIATIVTEASWFTSPNGQRWIALEIVAALSPRFPYVSIGRVALARRRYHAGFAPVVFQLKAKFPVFPF